MDEVKRNIERTLADYGFALTLSQAGKGEKELFEVEDRIRAVQLESTYQANDDGVYPTHEAYLATFQQKPIDWLLTTYAYVCRQAS